MAVTLTTRPCGCCRNGVEVCVQTVPVPEGPCRWLHFANGKVPDKAALGAMVAAMDAADAEQAKRAVVDAALDAELNKRKVAVDYSKSGADAVTTVFTTVAARV